MTNWPDKPLIRIKKGRESHLEVRDAVAAATGIDCLEGDYYMLSGPRAGHTIIHACTSDFIDEWEEVAAVPISALKRLQGAFRGVAGGSAGLLERGLAAVLEVTSHLPADKPSSLDTVVNYAKRNDRGSKVDVDGYVARLLRSMPSDTVHPEYLDLLRIAKESAQHLRWCGFLDPWAEIADEAGTLTLPETEDGRFTLLVKRIGAFLIHRDDDTATDIGAAALAWAAQIIKKEDE